MDGAAAVGTIGSVPIAAIISRGSSATSSGIGIGIGRRHKVRVVEEQLGF